MPAAQKSRHIGGFFVIWEQGSGLGECEGAKSGWRGKKREKKAEKSLPFGRRLNRIEEYMPLGDRSSMDSTRRKRTNSEGSRR
jgi:hypothetical protein